ncbi:N-carbamoyl-L-amino acid hydrolase [Baekduia alba]|uniref:allantoate amidohydrolase n=1 Tax=Baekduia alba TaxID=2997333 RepID=UPI002341EDB3|nr:allantoate amidohydrolase [Baekduia alba]WCB94613.1 N-carbamoyl-L-amino acid hydrolase [Baekduia alba]
MSFGDVIVERCCALAGVSEEPGRLTRRYATPAMTRANALVGSWMREAGMTARLDAAGNLVGRRPGLDPDAGTLLLGSHLDTVRDAGAFDGPLGVVLSIALVQRLREEGVALPFAIDVLGFADEEGLRFGTAYLGSRAVAGTFDPALFDVVDDDGVSVRQALLGFGGDPAGIGTASRRADAVLGYVEVHMEQGPVLEDRGAPVGVVTGIAGATRVEVRFAGQAGHAGTIPMTLRRDAAPAVAEIVLACEELARATEGLLATVGRMDVRPGAPNVVAGTGIAFLDVRHADDRVRAEAVASLRQTAEQIAAARRLELTWDVRLDNPAVAVDDRLTARLVDAAAGRGLAEVRLASGAGHDGVALAALCPIAMLFVRCADGLSHHPAESVSAEDAAVALDVLYDFTRALGSSSA